MKKIDLIIILFFFNLLSLFAQNSGFDAGIFFGANGIHIEGQNEVLYNSTDGNIWGSGGVSAGLTVKRNLAKSFYWTFDLRYIRKGSVYEFINLYGLQDFESIKLDYAELPISLGLRKFLGKRFIYFELGTSISKLLNSEKIVSDYSFGRDIALFDRFKDYDFSVLGAIKFSVNKKEKLILGLRVERSYLTIHEVYKLYNFDYGVELSYFF